MQHVYFIVIRPHRAVLRTYSDGLLLLFTDSVAWSVGLSHHWPLQKRLKRSRC